jgi:hypothetical protein
MTMAMTHYCTEYPCRVCHPEWYSPVYPNAPAPYIPYWTIPHYIPQPIVIPIGCICPVGAEKTCQGTCCPRKSGWVKSSIPPVSTDSKEEK